MKADRIKLLVNAVLAADRFFAESMPKMNVKDSALDADAINAWNLAEIAIAKAKRAIQ